MKQWSGGPELAARHNVGSKRPLVLLVTIRFRIYLG